MPLFEPTVPRRYLAPIFRALEAIPVDLRDRALAAAGLDRRARRQGEEVISLETMAALLETVASDPGHGDFGFDAGIRLAMQDHGPLAPVLLRAPTLEARLRIQAHYFRLITPIFSWRFTRLERGAELVVRPAAPFRALSLRVFFELYAAAHASNVSDLLSEAQPPFEIHMPFATPPHVARYRALRKVRFRFSQARLPEIRVVYPEEVLATRLNEGRLAIHEQRRLDRLQQMIARTPHVAEWTRLMLMEAEACQPSVKELATLLNMSQRSFERALASESVNFRKLSLRVRFERARNLLENPGSSVSQVAYRLGYGDLAAFSRAFQSMAGCSPSQFRRDHEARTEASGFPDPASG